MKKILLSLFIIFFFSSVFYADTIFISYPAYHQHATADTFVQQIDITGTMLESRYGDTIKIYVGNTLQNTYFVSNIGSDICSNGDVTPDSYYCSLGSTTNQGNYRIENAFDNDLGSGQGQRWGRAFSASGGNPPVNVSSWIGGDSAYVQISFGDDTYVGGWTIRGLSGVSTYYVNQVSWFGSHDNISYDTVQSFTTIANPGGYNAYGFPRTLNYRYYRMRLDQCGADGATIIEMELVPPNYNDNFSGTAVLMRPEDTIYVVMENGLGELDTSEIYVDFVETPSFEITYPQNSIETGFEVVTVGGTSRISSIGDSIEIYVNNVLNSRYLVTDFDQDWSGTANLQSQGDSIQVRFVNKFNLTLWDTISIDYYETPVITITTPADKYDTYLYNIINISGTCWWSKPGDTILIKTNNITNCTTVVSADNEDWSGTAYITSLGDSIILEITDRFDRKIFDTITVNQFDTPAISITTPSYIPYPTQTIPFTLKGSLGNVGPADTLYIVKSNGETHTIYDTFIFLSSTTWAGTAAVTSVGETVSVIYKNQWGVTAEDSVVIDYFEISEAYFTYPTETTHDTNVSYIQISGTCYSVNPGDTVEIKVNAANYPDSTVTLNSKPNADWSTYIQLNERYNTTVITLNDMFGHLSYDTIVIHYYEPPSVYITYPDTFSHDTNARVITISGTASNVRQGDSIGIYLYNTVYNDSNQVGSISSIDSGLWSGTVLLNNINDTVWVQLFTFSGTTAYDSVEINYFDTPRIEVTLPDSVTSYLVPYDTNTSIARISGTVINVQVNDTIEISVNGTAAGETTVYYLGDTAIYWDSGIVRLNNQINTVAVTVNDQFGRQITDTIYLNFLDTPIAEISYPSYTTHDTMVPIITISGSTYNTQTGDTVRIYDNNNPSTSVILTALNGSFSGTVSLSDLYDSIVIEINDRFGRQVYDTINVNYLHSPEIEISYPSYTSHDTSIQEIYIMGTTYHTMSGDTVEIFTNNNSMSVNSLSPSEGIWTWSGTAFLNGLGDSISAVMNDQFGRQRYDTITVNYFAGPSIEISYPSYTIHDTKLQIITISGSTINTQTGDTVRIYTNNILNDTFNLTSLNGDFTGTALISNQLDSIVTEITDQFGNKNYDTITVNFFDTPVIEISVPSYTTEDTTLQEIIIKGTTINTQINDTVIIYSNNIPNTTIILNAMNGSFSGTSLMTGPSNSITAEITDQFGRKLYDTITVNYFTNPNVSITSIDDSHDTKVRIIDISGTAVNTSAGDSIGIYVDNNLICTVTVNGAGDWSGTAVLNSIGDSVLAKVTDKFHYSAYDTITIDYFDIPVVEISSPSYTTHDTKIQDITISGSCLNNKSGDTVRIYVNNTVNTTVVLTSFNSDFSGTVFIPSEYDSVIVEINDQFGRQAYDTVTISYLPPPEVAITFPSDALDTYTNYTVLSGTCKNLRDGDTIVLKVDNTSIYVITLSTFDVTWSGSVTLNSIGDLVEAEINDQFGRQSADTITINYSPLPVITSVEIISNDDTHFYNNGIDTTISSGDTIWYNSVTSEGLGQQLTVNVTWSAVDKDSAYFTSLFDSPALYDNSGDTRQTYTVTDSAQWDTQLTVTVYNQLGFSDSIIIHFVKDNHNNDTYVLSILSIADTKSTTISCSWTVFTYEPDEDTGAGFSQYVLFYSKTTPVTTADNSWDSSNQSVLSILSNDSATISGLLPDQDYYITIAWKDRVGNLSDTVTQVYAKTAVPGILKFTLSSTPAGVVYENAPIDTTIAPGDEFGDTVWFNNNAQLTLNVNVLWIDEDNADTLRSSAAFDSPVQQEYGDTQTDTLTFTIATSVTEDTVVRFEIINDHGATTAVELGFQRDVQAPSSITGYWSESSDYMHVIGDTLYFNPQKLLSWVNAVCTGTSSDTGVGLWKAVFDTALGTSPDIDTSPSYFAANYRINIEDSGSGENAVHIAVYDYVSNVDTKTLYYSEDNFASGPLTGLDTTNIAATSASCTWTAYSTLNWDTQSGFKEYKIYYGTTSPLQTSSDSLVWNSSYDASLSDSSCTTTTLRGLEPNTMYYIILTWLDNCMNEALGTSEVSFMTGPDNADDNVRINEIFAEPSGAQNLFGAGTGDANNEFIELYNSGADSVNLTNWTLQDKDGNSITLNGYIPGYGWALLPAASTTIYYYDSNGDTFDVSNTYTGAWLVLDNVSETCILIANAGTGIDTVYHNAVTGKSYSREIDGLNVWLDADTPTPGWVSTLNRKSDNGIMYLNFPDSVLANAEQFSISIAVKNITGDTVEEFGDTPAEHIVKLSVSSGNLSIIQHAFQPGYDGETILTGITISGASGNVVCTATYKGLTGTDVITVYPPSVQINCPDDPADTEIQTITIRGTARNTYVGDSILIYVNNSFYDTAELGADNTWIGTAGLNGYGDSITVKLIKGTSEVITYDSITVNYYSAPTLEITLPADSTDTRDHVVTLSGTASNVRDNDTVSLYVNNQLVSNNLLSNTANGTGAWSGTAYISGFGDSITAKLTDQWSRVSYDTVTFDYFDTPSLEIIYPADKHDTIIYQITLSGTTAWTQTPDTVAIYLNSLSAGADTIISLSGDSSSWSGTVHLSGLGDSIIVEVNDRFGRKSYDTITIDLYILPTFEITYPDYSVHDTYITNIVIRGTTANSSAGETIVIYTGDTVNTTVVITTANGNFEGTVQLTSASCSVVAVLNDTFGRLVYDSITVNWSDNPMLGITYPSFTSHDTYTSVITIRGTTLNSSAGDTVVIYTNNTANTITVLTADDGNFEGTALVSGVSDSITAIVHNRFGKQAADTISVTWFIEPVINITSPVDKYDTYNKVLAISGTSWWSNISDSIIIYNGTTINSNITVTSDSQSWNGTVLLNGKGDSIIVELRDRLGRRLHDTITINWYDTPLIEITYPSEKIDTNTREITVSGTSWWSSSSDNIKIYTNTGLNLTITVSSDSETWSGTACLYNPGDSVIAKLTDRFGRTSYDTVMINYFSAPVIEITYPDTASYDTLIQKITVKGTTAYTDVSDTIEIYVNNTKNDSITISSLESAWTGTAFISSINDSIVVKIEDRWGRISYDTITASYFSLPAIEITYPATVTHDSSTQLITIKGTTSNTDSSDTIEIYMNGTKNSSITLSGLESSWTGTSLLSSVGDSINVRLEDRWGRTDYDTITINFFDTPVVEITYPAVLEVDTLTQQITISGTTKFTDKGNLVEIYVNGSVNDSITLSYTESGWTGTALLLGTGDSIAVKVEDAAGRKAWDTITVNYLSSPSIEITYPAIDYRDTTVRIMTVKGTVSNVNVNDRIEVRHYNTLNDIYLISRISDNEWSGTVLLTGLGDSISVEVTDKWDRTAYDTISMDFSLSQSNSWYVDAVNGSVSNDGLTVSSPKKYISQITKGTVNGNFTLLSRGDTIHIASGTYSETIVIDTDYITLTGTDSSSVIISPPGDSITPGVNGLYIYNSKDITVNNLQITGSYNGINLYKTISSNLDNVTVTGCSTGIILQNSSNNNVISNSYLANNLNGLSVNSSDNNYIHGNISENNLFTGFYFYLSNNNLLKWNKSKINNGSGFKFVSSDNNLISQNLSYMNKSYGFYIEGYISSDTFEKNNFIPSSINPDSGVYANPTKHADFRYNYWSTTDSAVVNRLISEKYNNVVTYQPFRLNEIDISENGDTVAPGQPLNFSLDTSVLRQTTLSWGKPFTDENGEYLGAGDNAIAGYKIYRITADSALSNGDTNDWHYYELANITTPQQFSFTDSDIKEYVTYYYVITSYDRSYSQAEQKYYTNESWYSKILKASTKPTPYSFKVYGSAFGLGKKNSSYDSLYVVVKDVLGEPIKDVLVTFEVDSWPSGASNFSILHPLVKTDQNGKAKNSFTFGNKTGVYVVKASCSSFDPVYFTFNTEEFELQSNKWSMVSIIKKPVSNNVSDVFSGISLDNIYYWDPSGSDDPFDFNYRIPEKIYSGYSYFLKNTSNVTLEVGGAIVEDTFYINLSPGWNQIGNPFAFPVNLSEIKINYNDTLLTFTDAGEQDIVYNAVYWYKDGGYAYGPSEDIPDPQLIPWKGSWVKSNVSCTLVIPPAPPDYSKKPLILAPKKSYFKAVSLSDWSLQLIVESDYGSDNFNFLGSQPGAVDGLDTHDKFKAPPPVNNYTVGYIELGTNKMAASYTDQINDYKIWEIALRTDKPNSDYTLRWNDMSNVPGKTELLFYLYDPENNILTDMRTVNSIEGNFNGSYERRYSIKVFKPSFSVLLNESLEKQNTFVTPNPGPDANGYIHFKFNLGEVSRVSISIYDIAGYLVKKLSENKNAGSDIEIQWDCKNNRGYKAANGFYIYRIEISGLNSGRSKKFTDKFAIMK